MDRLFRNAERVGNLVPRPPLRAGVLHLYRLEPLEQTPQGRDGTKPDLRILRGRLLG
jgi:hypothetical protein